jgi:signal transduction histidine kinase
MPAQVARQDVIDVVAALVLCALTVIEVTSSAPDGSRSLDSLGVVLLLLQTLPIAVRRRYPIAVIWLTGLSVTGYAILGYPTTIGGIGNVVAFYTVAVRLGRKPSGISLAIASVCIVIGSAVTVANGWIPAEILAWNLVAYLVTWVVADTVRGRRIRAAEAEALAASEAREREDRARLAVAEERTRIARELHDVVAHHVTVMVVQAGAARRSLDSSPEDAREALAAVESVGRTTLEEMRRILGVLRAGPDDETLQPQPGIDRLPALLDQTREAGLPVALTVEGAPRTLPPGIDLTAYRIVQEALTNTLKHAGRASATVTLRYKPDSFAIEVADDGRGAAALATYADGHGLVGMRERVGVFGGRLDAGPRPSGGYAVRAVLPLDGAA